MSDPVFWTALRNNAIYALWTIPLSIVLALAMALAVNTAIPGRALVEGRPCGVEQRQRPEHAEQPGRGRLQHGLEATARAHAHR
jgi:hypothetical protein